MMNPSRLPKGAGYWGEDDDPSCPLPRPQMLVGVGWQASELDRIVSYLRGGHTFARWFGSAYCRFGHCGRRLGSQDLTDGMWIWPQGLEHYLLHHQVGLPETFVDTMRSHDWQVPAATGLPSVSELQAAGLGAFGDLSEWIAWSRKVESPGLAAVDQLMEADLKVIGARAGSGDLPAPLRPEEVDRFEEASGLRLPTLLRAVYLRVANGGFGPGSGLLPLLPGAAADLGESVLELYGSFRRPDPEDPRWFWPRQLLPISHWGCAIRSCVNCGSAAGAVIRFDPNGRQPGASRWSGFAPESPSVRAWFLRWAGGG